MATTKPFVVKNGLTIETYGVVAANGVWIGDTLNIKGPQGPQGASGPQGSSGKARHGIGPRWRGQGVCR